METYWCCQECGEVIIDTQKPKKCPKCKSAEVQKGLEVWKPRTK